MSVDLGVRRGSQELCELMGFLKKATFGKIIICKTRPAVLRDLLLILTHQCSNSLL